MKIITICGSLKFKEEMLKIALDKELDGDCVITPIFPSENDKRILTSEQIKIFNNMHKEKIKISDAILVVNVNGYIGDTTKSEIEYAKELNKEIIYLEEK